MGSQMLNRLITHFAAKKRPLHFTDSSGFTLIETLVAAVILFTCLAAASISYNTAVNLTKKLNSTIDIDTAVSDIREKVKAGLFNGELKGEASFSAGLKYSWEAVARKSSPTILGDNDEMTGGLQYGQFQITLYAVNLIVTAIQHEQPHNVRFEYNELVWRKTGVL